MVVLVQSERIPAANAIDLSVMADFHDEDDEAVVT